MGSSKQNAFKVYPPGSEGTTFIDVNLSLSGAKKGCLIGAAIASRVPHPIALPVLVVGCGLIGAVVGEPD